MAAMRVTTGEIREGGVLKTLLRLSVPSMIAFAFQTSFNFVDRFFVSRLGEIQFGAVGMAFTIQSLLIAIGSGVGIGSTSLIARRIGADNINEARRASEHSLFLAAAVSALFAAGGPCISKPLFLFLGASGEMLPYILDYVNMILAGSPFIFITMIISGILRGEGNTVSPMRAMLVANLVNLVLDPLLIFGPGPFPALGVFGAALATIIGRGFAAVYLLVSLFSRKNVVRPKLKGTSLSAPIFGSIFRVGGPAMIAQLANTFGLSLFFIILKPFGDAVKAAYTIGFTFNQAAFLPVLGLSQGVLTMAGQNFGARRRGRVMGVYKTGMIVAVMINLFLAALTLLFRASLVRIFAGSDEVIGHGMTILAFAACGYMFYGFRQIAVNTFMGIGLGFRSLVINLAFMIFFNLPPAYLLSKIVGITGVWTGMLIGNGIASVFGAIWAMRTIKKVSFEKVPAMTPGPGNTE